MNWHIYRRLCVRALFIHSLTDSLTRLKADFPYVFKHWKKATVTTKNQPNPITQSVRASVCVCVRQRIQFSVHVHEGIQVLQQ